MANKLVGARELKTRLGTYLRRVRRGDTLVITDRGQPVAELRPLETNAGVEAVLTTLSAGGLVTRARAQQLVPFHPIKSRGGSTESAVLEDPRDR